MKVFISWSGEKSLKVANALRDWLPMILQSVEPWISSSSIERGERWSTKMSEILANVDFGIICLTKENINTPWILFEAGAISKNTQSKIIPFLIDLDYSELKGPLSQFQATKAYQKEDLKKLILGLNRAAEKVMPEKLIDNLFENLYSNFESVIKSVLEDEAKRDNVKSIVEESSTCSLENKIDEILDILKSDVTTYRMNEIVKKQRISTVGKKPRVFIGSSSEGLEICYAIQENLEYYAETTVWNQELFELSSTVIESIVDIVFNFDFAILIFTPDDYVIKRGIECVSPRDNVIFELGLFIGTLGRGRTFLVYDRDSKINMPSDIFGVTAATFSKRNDNNLRASLMPVCQRIKRAMGVADE